MKKKKILIIDDFHPLLEEIVEFVNMEGYKALSANDGVEGIQVAIQEKPDLIICDIQMPKMNGYDVYRTLEKIPETATIPFIFLTALTQVQDFRKGLELGADDYLIKPFELDNLLLTIKKRLEKHDRYSNINKNKLDAIIYNPLIGTYIFKKDKLILTNKKFIEITSYSKKDFNEIKIEEILVGQNEKLISDFKLCLSGIRDSFLEKTSFINIDKKAVFIEIFGKHITIEGENAIIGTITDYNIKENSKPIADELTKVTEYLINAGKEKIAEEINNVKDLISFNTEKKETEIKIKLTKRELEILKLICKGLTNNEIAKELFISNRTVDNHRANLLSKTETKNTALLVAYAFKNQLIK